METASAFQQSTEIHHDPGYKWRVLAVVVLGLFMVVLDSTVVNVALKTLQIQFAASTDQAQWVISLYTLALGISTPLSGFLGDRFGVKRIYLLGLGLFACGSLFSGLAAATTFLPYLIAARGLQGIGGGIALPLGTALLFRAFPQGERAAAFGLFGIVLVFAPAVGPLLGGWLVDHNELAWIFLLNVPIGALALLVGWRLLHEAPGSQKAHIDLPGIFFSALGFGAVLFASSIAGEQGMGWGSPRVLVSLAGGAVSLVIFVLIELRTSDPLMDLDLFAIPSFAIANVTNMIGIIALFGAEFLLPLYLQILRGESAFQAGLILLPLAIASAIIGVLAGRLSDRIGPRIPIAVGFALIVYNTYQFAQLQLDSSLLFIMFLLALRGIGIGLILQNSQVAALLDVPLSRLNRATPLVQATRQTTQSIGVAVLATILSSAITISIPKAVANGGAPDLSHLPPAARALAEQGFHTFQSQYITGLEHAYLLTCVVALVATGVALFLPGWPGKYHSKERNRPVARAAHEQKASA